MTVSGTPKFNALAVAKLEANFTGPTVSLKSTAAFIDEKSGHTHGWTEGYGEVWSEKTMRRLDDLRQSIEEDIAAKHFQGAARDTRDRDKDPEKGIQFEGGIGEHLGDDRTPSI
jgi:hypothetical protein